MSIKDKILGIMSDMFGVETYDIKMDLGIGDLPNWDSLANVNLLSTIQEELEIEFEPEEMIELETVEDIINLSEKKANIV